MLNNTFVDLCLNGKALTEDIDDFVSRWHSSTDGRTLREYLGLTPLEYNHWVKDERAIRRILFCRKTGQPFSDEIFDTDDIALAARTSDHTKSKELHKWIVENIQK